MTDSVRIPADVEREDRILAGLSARQLVILAVTAVLLWFAYSLTARWLPLVALVIAALPVVAFAAALALGRWDGLSGDRFALAALAHYRAPKRLVPAPAGVAPVPPWWARPHLTRHRPVPMHLPFRDIEAGGVVNLEAAGAAVVCRASSLNFGLRSPAEQAAMTAAYGRFLNSLASGVQIVVQAQRADVGDAIADLHAAASTLPSRALVDAAADHARYIASLAERRDVLRRSVFIVFRDPNPAAGPALARRAEEAASALAAAGVALTPLSREEAAAVFARSVDPDTTPRRGTAAPGAIITGARA